MNFEKQFLGIFLINVFFMEPIQSKTSAITYDIRGGRFGDQLACYVKAKIIAHVLSMPFLYKPGMYFDQLMMHSKEEHLDKHVSKFEKMITIQKLTRDTIKKNSGTVYAIGYYANLGAVGIDYATIQKKVFLDELRNMICPQKKLADVFRPTNQITVALHVRKGGGHDSPLYSDLPPGTSIPNKHYQDYNNPMRFPPDTFYIEQLARLSEMLGNKPLYVHIFTDDLQPKKILEKYKKALEKYKNLTFATRDIGNFHEINVLEDFFSISKFDCLIRPESFFSYMAEIIGNHQLIISPTKHIWKNNKLIISDVRIIDRRSRLDNLKLPFGILH